MKDFLEKLESNNLLKEVTRITVALSGGADSMALLHILQPIALKRSISFGAVHIHHGLRDASDNEAEMVKKWCENLGIDLTIHRVDVESQMAKGMSLEEAARECRYKVFQTYCTSSGEVIALGHHRDDQVETVLLNLFRGSGLKGLGGIQPKRDCYIRPLLDYSKQDILEYCHHNDIDYVFDESNNSKVHRRNALRLDLIPEIEKVMGRGINEGISKMSGLLREEEAT